MSKRERAAMREASVQRDVFARRHEQIQKITLAIAALAEMHGDPADFIRHASPEIVEHAENAVFWLKRFAELWHGQSEKSSAKNEISRY